MTDNRRPLGRAVREEFEEGTGITFRPWRWLARIAIAVVLIALLAWALAWVTQPLRTSSGIRERIGNPDHALFQYEHFHDLCAGVIALDQKIALKRDEIADYDQRYPQGDQNDRYQAAPKRDRLQTEMTGLQQQRADQVSKYNADSVKFNRALFKDRNLPERLNESTPSCN
ncbi:hypothetical protein [Nonomuraea sp. NPDC049695]|uniref:hypothetical protein n=1 Tax=Nonomuraea sp. NPDC049695 TaxID=3154734 RepID=UPI00342DE6DA